MLEGTVARILNQLLGKYVQDLDTENLNVGIFSGTVQLTDLKLKPEALYELNLPIEVKIGTIGKIQIQIPWNALWNQSVVVNIDDIHIIANPVVSNQEFDAEKNKRIVRAFKKRTLELLENDGGVLGGPSAFAEHLVSHILNYVQLNITNIHIRYEDDLSWTTPVAAGLCIGSITAQSTNSKWKRIPYEATVDTSYYLIKIEATSIYWNTNSAPKKWDLPSQYYQWRNSMVKSLQNYCYEGESFKFVLSPLISKIKMTISKSNTGHVADINTDIVIQDCNVQISKDQYDSIMAIISNFDRMLISWQYFSKRPQKRILEDQKAWWRYACWATIEQRIKPLTWSRIKLVRSQYKQYMETYKQIIVNPNDTELRMDLQKHEDNLSVINVVIARQHTRLLMRSKSQSEKSFWSMLPSPEKIVLCQKIGYYDQDENPRLISHLFTFKLGNLNVTLTSDSREVVVATITQTLVSAKPNFLDKIYRISLKVEGLIVEGNGPNNCLTPMVSSEHLKDSPAFFFTMILEKSKADARSLQMTLSSVECIYNKKSFQELEAFLQTSKRSERINLLKSLRCLPSLIYKTITKMISDKWELNLNLKCPYFVIPESSSCIVPEEHVLVIDFGKYFIRTEICRQTQVSESTTKMEMEEQLYSKLHIDCTNLQVLFCDKHDHWKEARNEKDSEMHIVPKAAFSAIYALSAVNMATIPSLKFNIACTSLKLNVSERKISSLLKFFNVDQIRINVITEAMQPDIYKQDRIREYRKNKIFRRVRDLINLADTYKYRKHKVVNGDVEKLSKTKSIDNENLKNNMNEAWARTIDLPGLEDNISPSNNIQILFGVVVNECSMVFSKSSDSTDRQYLMLRVGQFSMDVAFMTFGPAYQMSIHSIILTDKLHTTSSGQYLDLVFTPLPNTGDVITVLYRKVSANCRDFWSHFHGVETSLVANFGTLHLLLHQEAIHTLIKYSKYLSNKIKYQTSPYLKTLVRECIGSINKTLHKPSEVPVPPGSVKFSQSARMSDLNMVICDADYDIVSIQLSGLEIDSLFRANERFVFRGYLGSINVDHLNQVTLYSKVLYTDEDKVFEVKYVRNASHIKNHEVLSKQYEETFDGSFKFQLGRIHFIFLYKLMVQLQRFIMNLEIIEYVESYLNLIRRTVKAATDTLKNKTKISLAIGVSGPIILIPQKSSSPNVILIDTGNLRIENFFKESDNRVVENILVKLKDATITRGVMGLRSSIETQETLMEPLCINMDVKKFTNTKTSQKNWEIDSILEKIEVTLGQKDIALMLSVYNENIGEAQLVDLLPEQIRSPISEIFEQDDNVRELEAFFCEPKQKFLNAKFKIDEIKVTLFFDASELLSSPIRDLNHGLFKLEIYDIDNSLIIYTDKSSDGKLSVDKILVEEIGPDANINSKTVLGAPAEDGRNNNICNITVNKPPIIDVNFHQNKSGDKSADIIVGRMCLCLSIPFCEKMALYILECLPNNLQDIGIVNKGYEAEMTSREPKRLTSNSLTISLRVNKPELMFLVETTSNKKRYFITKSEIMVDLSRHRNRLNLIISLSGLHNLFYDLSEYSDQPYVVLKPCDVELTKNVEDSTEKIVLNVSGVYVKVCSEVVHSLDDIINDIEEHFKIPDMELARNVNKVEKTNITEVNEELWMPKKMDAYIDKVEPDCPRLPTHVCNQVLTLPKFEAVLILELEKMQALLIKTSIEIHAQDWNYLLNCTADITLQANYFNENMQSWEPLIDPVLVEESDYRPWGCQVKIFVDKSQPINDKEENLPVPKKRSSSNTKMKKSSRSYTTTESEDSGEDMIYLLPTNLVNHTTNRRVKTSLSTFLDDSDSENEEGTMEKLAAAISDLFTGDWNENEDSECDHSSEDEEEENLISVNERPKQHPEEHKFHSCVYFLVNAKDCLNLTITPAFLRLFSELMAQYSSKIFSVKSLRKTIEVTNDIGPQTKVELFEKNSEKGGKDVLINVKRFEAEDSIPNSPTRHLVYHESTALDVQQLELDLLELDRDYEQGYDFATVRSLRFLQETTASLYDKINKNYLKIFVPFSLPVQTNCSKRNWEKLVKLQSMNNSSIPTANYCLAVRHRVGRHGRSITVSSPLQIHNETCFALNILYQPSVLQQMNVEPVGDVTNPFETTMRIAILEPYETYNVPLFIAYHCKLFIQPAYAEGHYASESGLWWRDMSREMDATYNLICKPKNESNLEIFALRVTMQRNLEIRNNFARAVPNYLIKLLPPLTVQNFLPYTLEVENVSLKQVVKADPGEKCSIYSLDLSRDEKFAIKMTYNNITWSGTLNVTGHLDDKLIPMLSDQNPACKTVHINVKCERDGTCKLIFYSPYWIVNKTGLPLKIKASHAQNVQECPNNDILLFTYKRHSKQSLNIKVHDSMWSSDFTAECSGTTGLIICKDNERNKKYMFFMSSSLSNFCPRLTKIVTLSPSFLVSNYTRKSLRFMEDNERTDLWIDLEPCQTVTYWPDTATMKIFVKYRESNLISQAIGISKPQRTVLRMDKGTAITVEVTGGTSGPFCITFNKYKPGDSPVLIRNYCSDLYLKIQQKDQSHVSLVNPNHCMLYTWDNPVLPRVLVWSVYNNKGSGFTWDIYKDGHGEERIKFHSVSKNTDAQDSSSSEDSDSSDSTPNKLNKQVRKDKIVIYWACFVDGPQRILLFTQEQRIYENILANYFHEHCIFETILSVAGLGLSVFTSENDKKEHMYASICDSPPIWEVNVGHKWKTLTLELASWIEDKYKRHNNTHKKCQIKDYVHIDFEKMFMLKPFFAEIRRTYTPGLNCHFRKSPRFQFLDFKLNYLQIDNKHSNCIVLQPVFNSNELQDKYCHHRPLVRIEALKQTEMEFDRIRYVKISLRDISLNIENDLWTKLGGCLKECRKLGRDYSCTGAFVVDISSIRKDITSSLHNYGVYKDHQSTSRIENFSLSGFGIQLMISNRIQISILSDTTNLNRVLDYLFPYNMAPYMPAEGVHHKITCLEGGDSNENIYNILLTMADHVANRFLQQYYSQVLGLQVLVNSFDRQANVKLPTLDPPYTASIIFYACQCLLGHVSMSPAAIETCILDVFPNLNLENCVFGKNSIRKRGSEAASDKEDCVLPKIVAQSAKHFELAVPLALEQLFVKNYGGNIQCDGEMFFKTSGKALLSLITRHPDEKSDCVELAREALRRALILGEPIKIHQRVTRYKNVLGLTPFSPWESMGQYLLETIGNCRLSNDRYWAHAAIDRSGKHIILVSLEHVLRANKTTLWGSWEIEWMVDLDDINSLPIINCVELILNMRQTENSQDDHQVKITGPKEVLVWLHEKIEQAIILSMEDKSWALPDPE
ncbi:intermembrane lipid transfer protein VPS13C-like [Anthonomus grandis grandis]|uniref:intermembrane lipid transfer protein VPS13C-like n=1 Tax=Anthonomus grandis grandis TaxID=2921223 RepID=UPI00216586E0|nr:intermembrane lipid transfer protein VPS13C-like [Anthonomus grandis grandis]